MATRLKLLTHHARLLQAGQKAADFRGHPIHALGALPRGHPWDRWWQEELDDGTATTPSTTTHFGTLPDRHRSTASTRLAIVTVIAPRTRRRRTVARQQSRAN